MRADSGSPKSDENPSQKQDPLERRRLQNRLSQRNHRRKIRDRIAKLQERVIANELRAAAALNNWDQKYVPSPLISPFHGSHQDAHFIHSRDPSPLATESSPPFIPPYTMPATPSWPNEWRSSQHLGISPGESSFFMDGGFMGDATCSSPSLTHPMNNMGLSTSNGPERDILHDANAGGPVTTDAFCSSTTNQPLYYVATETALPQILQALNTVSPQSSIIVLVPDSATGAITNPISTSGLPGNHSMEHVPSNQLNTQILPCHCQAQSIQAASATHMISNIWQAPRTYGAVCQPSKPPATGGTFPAMRL